MTHGEKVTWGRRSSVLCLGLAAILAVLPGCEKARDIAGKIGEIGKKPPAASTAKPYAGGLVSELGEGEYEAFRQQPGRVIVIDFHADWCGPCRKLSPILAEVAAAHEGLVLVGKVNVDQSPKLASGAGVSSIPDVRIFRDGKEVDRFVGLPARDEVKRRIEKHLQGLPPIPAESPASTKPAPAEPVTQPMPEDWLPPGMQRR